VGSAYRHLTSLEKLASNKVTIHQQLTAAQMCQLMQACSLAILPPSTVAYEWCSVGGPLFLIQTAENQKNLKNFLLQTELAQPYTKLNTLLPLIGLSLAYFGEQLNKQRQLFDGQSPARLRQVIDQLFYPDLLHLRRAQSGDLQLLFHWINDPVVRRFSLNPEPVSLTTHSTWYRYKITDKNCFIFIAEIRQEPVGMIRFDVNHRETIISYLVDENYRGKGLGTLLLQQGIFKFKINARKTTSISGLVQKENIASIKAFTKAGFKINPESDKNYPHVLKFTLLT
jgi:UDP-2,4-diacetamido-2,4,6-trideoxy-beta-L-altropyranose hydrolase